MSTLTWPLLPPTTSTTGSTGNAVTSSNLLNAGVDLELDKDGDLLLDGDLSFTRGLCAVAQGINLRVRTFQGEWFLDLSLGVPYFQEILGFKFNEIRIDSIFRDVITDAPGAENLIQLVSTFSASTRLLNVSWEVDTGLVGDEITGKIDFEV